MRRKRDKYIGIIEFIEELVNQCQQADKNNGCFLEAYQAQLEEEWRQFRLAQEDLDHGEGDPMSKEKTLDIYMSLGARLKVLILAEQPSTPSTSKGIDFPWAKVHLSEMRLPEFDGKFEYWRAFYNTFNSTIDKNHYLTLL